MATGSITASGPGLAALEPCLTHILPGWRSEAVADVPPGKADIACATASGKLRLSVAALDREVTAATSMEAAYHLADALMDLALLRDASLLGLHAAAVRLHDGAVLLLGDRGVGKSTIAATLAAMGQAVLGDDRVFLRCGPSVQPTCLATGFALMLRLPLPASAGANVRSFVARQGGVRHEDSLFMPLRSPESEALRDAFPVTACLWLARTDRAVPSLTAMSRGDATRAILDHAWTPSLDNQAFLERVSDAAASVPMLRLEFGDAAAAADAIVRRFEAAGSEREEERT